MNTPVWRKSSRSTQGTSETCVELADLGATVGVRDSKDPRGPHLSVTLAVFSGLVDQIKAGQLDR